MKLVRPMKKSFPGKSEDTGNISEESDDLVPSGSCYVLTVVSLHVASSAVGIAKFNILQGLTWAIRRLLAQQMARMQDQRLNC